MTVQIRPQRPADDDEVASLLTSAFGDDGRVATLAQALCRRADTHAELIAVDGSEIVGSVGLSISWLDAPWRLIEVLTLSPLAVTPQRQGQGVGAQLLGAARGEAQALGCPLLFLEGDPGYYRRHGWLEAGALGFTAPSTRIPSAAFQVVALPGYDAAAMSGRLVYNDTFWTHDCVGLR